MISPAAKTIEGRGKRDFQKPKARGDFRKFSLKRKDERTKNIEEMEADDDDDDGDDDNINDADNNYGDDAETDVDVELKNFLAEST